MSIQKKLLLLFTLLSISLISAAKGYKISLHIDGLADSTVLLALYSGESKFAVDTAVLDSKGNAVFSKPKPLESGMYLMVAEGAAMFDLLISDESSQTFSIKTSKSSYFSSLQFIGSPENEMFLTYIKRKNELSNQQDAIAKQLTAKQTREQIDSLNVEGRSLRKKQAAFSDSIAAAFNGKTIAMVVNALNVPEPPPVTVPSSDPSYDSLVFMSYHTFSQDHFFDRMDLSDERLTRTPFFESMLFYYFDRLLIYQEADSLIPYIDRVIEKTAPSKLMFRFVLSNLFNHYMESKIMGHEGIVVHLAEKYYFSDEVDWEQDRFRAELEEFVRRNKPTLLGRLAPPIRMEQLTGGIVTLTDIDAPLLILYFYEPSCGHCKSETPKVKSLFEKYSDKGVQVLAVFTQQDRKEWEKYVDENGLNWINVWDPSNTTGFRDNYNVYTTPQLYLLDKDRKVKARRLDAETLDKLIGSLLD